jgi:VanZ family protein
MSMLIGARQFNKPGLWWVLGSLLVLTVCVLSLIHLPQMPLALPKVSDKWQHVLAYFAMMGWFSQLIVRKRTLIKAALCFFAMGVALEFLQGLTGYRSLDHFDVLANSTGILLGLAIAFTRLALVLSWVDRRLFGVV